MRASSKSRGLRPIFVDNKSAKPTVPARVVNIESTWVRTFGVILGLVRTKPVTIQMSSHVRETLKEPCTRREVTFGLRQIIVDSGVRIPPTKGANGGPDFEFRLAPSICGCRGSHTTHEGTWRSGVGVLVCTKYVWMLGCISLARGRGPALELWSASNIVGIRGSHTTREGAAMGSGLNMFGLHKFLDFESARHLRRHLRDVRILMWVLSA